MDVLFPWRKQQVQPQFQSGGDGYHSLPHPQEHAAHYDGFQNNNTRGPAAQMMQSFQTGTSGSGYESQRGFDQNSGHDSGYGGQSQRGFDSGGQGGQSGRFDYGPESARNLAHLDSFRTESQRLFEGEGMSQMQPSVQVPTKPPSESTSTGDHGMDDSNNMDAYGGSGRSFGPDGNNMGDAYGDSGRSGFGQGYDDGGGTPMNASNRSGFGHAGGGVGTSMNSGPRFRPPIGLDGSNRSATSDLTDRTPGGRPRGQGGMPPQAQYGSQYEPDLVPVQENPNVPAGRGAPKPDRRSLMNSFSTQNQSSRSSRSFAHDRSSRSFGTSYGGPDAYMEEEEDLPVSPLRQLLDAVNMSILPASLRLSSLAQVVEFFDHRDRAMHDAELREGGAFVLYHKLSLASRLGRSGELAEEGVRGTGATDGAKKDAGPNHYLNYQRSLASSLAAQQQTEFDKEIAMICSCLEMVHRANPDAIAQTWDECGTEILPLLVHVLERPFQKIERAVWMALQEKANVPGSLERAVAMAVTRDQKLAVQKVTKVLAMYSLVPEAKKPMCDCAGMLKWLTRIIDTHNYNRVKPGAPQIGGTTGAVPGADGDADPKRAKRLELAARATSGSGLYMTEAARFNTIATLTNLAALEANRMPMLHEAGLLDNICRAVHNERSDVPKQCSALAIMNLSNGDMDHVPEMARNDLVLETLLKLMKEDNPETRRNAVVTIFNVACSDQNTVRLARYRDGTILEALVELVGSDDPVLRTHDEARANAAETIFNMSCSEISETTDRMANHAGLLECLAVTLRGEHTGLEVKMYCSATLRRMAELVRHPMIAQGALLSALVKAASWTDTDCIAEAFRAQASHRENCVIMAHHHGLLNALSRLALTRGEGPEAEKVRMASCLAIELMSRHDEARALLSQNEGIIMALTKASYGEEEREADLRRSNVSDMDDSASGFLDTSGKSGRADEDEEDGSMQSRRIQLALKNLVAAM